MMMMMMIIIIIILIIIIISSTGNNNNNNNNNNNIKFTSCKIIIKYSRVLYNVRLGLYSKYTRKMCSIKLKFNPLTPGTFCKKCIFWTFW